MNREQITERLGHVSLAPEGPVVAGSVGTWTLTYTVGSYGVDEGGTLKLARRFASDWEIPQFEDPRAPGFATLHSSGEARLRPTYRTKGHERPWMKALVIDVYDGSLAPGDTVTLVLGERSGGSPGSRAQTFQESAHEFRFLVDPTNAGVALPLPSSPKIPIVAGEPVRLVAILPSQALIGEEAEIFIKGEDLWGNPTRPPNDLVLEWEGDGDAVIQNRHLIGQTAGSGRVVVSADGMRAGSNPITFHSAPPTYRRFWGDLHAQTAGTVGTGSEDEYFTFGREWARLDFMSHQGNDFQIDDEYWRHLNETTRRFNDEGRFVVFPGYEWSANTPAGGDRNVFYRREGYPILRSSHWQIPHVAEGDGSPAHPADRLFAELSGRVPKNDYLCAAHVGGRYADIRRYFDEESGPLVEVLSCWGVFEWMLWDAFEKGYTIGVMCNSDGHKGRPGAEGPGAGEFGIAGGLTCVLAEALSRDGVFDALQQRRCYGTSGARIDVDFRSGDHPMGSVLSVDGPVNLQATAVGDAPLESLVLLRGRDEIARVTSPDFATDAPSNRIRVRWGGARIRGRGRRVVWNGTISLNGAQIVRAEPYSFDTAADGIQLHGADRLTFQSSTTGDEDGVDLYLDQGAQGTIRFESPPGDFELDLAEIALIGQSRRFEFGGLNIGVGIERYPEDPREHQLRLETVVEPPAQGRTPYLIRVTQIDGHRAWTSPIYLESK